MQQFNEGLRFVGERYEVSLPSRKDHPELKNNYNQAFKRLLSVENQLKKNEDKDSSYSQTINQYAQDGYAEQVKVNSDNNKPEKVRDLQFMVRTRCPQKQGWCSMDHVVMEMKYH